MIVYRRFHIFPIVLSRVLALEASVVPWEASLQRARLRLRTFLAFFARSLDSIFGISVVSMVRETDSAQKVRAEYLSQPTKLCLTLSLLTLTTPA